VTLGGQRLEGVDSVSVSGPGVSARVLEYNKQMNPQEIQLLREQLNELRANPAQTGAGNVSNLTERLEKFIDDYVQQPQCASIANTVVAEVTVAKDAPLGEREIRVVTPNGLSNPMAFHVGQLPEVTAPPLPTSAKQILGKEALSLRKRKREKKREADMAMESMQMAVSMAGPGAQSDVDDDEVTLHLPCTVNGQIASGSVDRFRFSGARGQRLVVRVLGRALVPYMADAVPAGSSRGDDLRRPGREVAYDDDYRFKPDPVLLCDIPADGEYVLAVYDAIFAGARISSIGSRSANCRSHESVSPRRADRRAGADRPQRGESDRTSALPPMKEATGVCLLTAHGGTVCSPTLFRSRSDALPDAWRASPTMRGKMRSASRCPSL
jgi:hypothetical protein